MNDLDNLLLRPDTMPRRRALLAASVGLLAASSPAAWAQAAWPSKPVRMVVAFPAGGLADVLIRILEAQLVEALGQPVLIDNRGGAAGNLAATEVVRNGTDGHTFLVTVTTTESVNPVMFKSMPVDPQRDLQHVALLANTQLFLVVKPTLPVNSVKELVAYAKANPGKLSYGSPGAGTTPHLAGELFKQGAGIFATHIPYRGAAPVIQDVMANQIDFAFVPGTVFPMVKSGRMKLLAVASRQRTSNYPSAPTFSELGIDRVWADTLFGIYAPSAMPVANVARVQLAVNRLLVQPAIKARFAELGADALPLSIAEFKKTVQDETRLFTEVIKSRGITPD